MVVHSIRCLLQIMTPGLSTEKVVSHSKNKKDETRSFVLIEKGQPGFVSFGFVAYQLSMTYRQKILVTCFSFTCQNLRKQKTHICYLFFLRNN